MMFSVVLSIGLFATKMILKYQLKQKHELTNDMINELSDRDTANLNQIFYVRSMST